jgi:hypothetical protein
MKNTMTLSRCKLSTRSPFQCPRPTVCLLAFYFSVYLRIDDTTGLASRTVSLHFIPA